MASKYCTKFTLCLHACAASTVLIEILQSFIQPNNLLASISAASATFFENWAFATIYLYITIYGLILFIHAFVRSVLYFRPDLREKAKESIRKRREAQKLKEEAKPKPSALTRFYYHMFWPLVMIINGSIYQREAGTSLVEGATRRVVTVATKVFFIYVIELIAVLILICLGGVMLSIFRATCRSRTAKTPAAIEEGKQEITEVKGGIYTTAANYIEASIFDEKLVDLDEPMPKLVDVDEPALHTVEPVTRAPVDLL